MAIKRIQNYLPLLGMLIVFLVDFIFIYTLHRNWTEGMLKYIPLKDHISFFAIDIGNGHLWLEEVLEGDLSLEYEKNVHVYFTESVRKNAAFVQKFSEEFRDVHDQEITKKLMEIGRQFDTIHDLADKRWEEKSGIGTVADAEFDKLFISLQALLKALNIEVNRYVNEELELRNQYFVIIILIFLSVNIAAFTFLFMIKHSNEIYEKSLVDEQEKLLLAKENLQAQYDFIQNVMDNSVEPIMVIDKEYNVTMSNKAAKANTNMNIVSDPKNIKCYELSHNSTIPCSGLEHPCPLRDIMQHKKAEGVLHVHKDSKGKDRIVELNCSPLLNREGETEGIIEVERDITRRLRIQEQLELEQDRLTHISNHDPLTNLPNRRLFFDRLNEALKQAEFEKESLAVIMIDLDNFKEINDSLGHSIGDMVLIEAASRIKSVLSPADTLARLGGDEFAILHFSIANVEDTSELLGRLMQSFEGVFQIESHEMYITVSVGISVFPEDSTLPEFLLRNADAALFRSKELGRNTYQFYTEDMTEKALERITMETSLRQAIEKEEFIVYYQPQMDLSEDTLSGMEALVRWQHPSMGLVPPVKFIALAEETGLIIEIDRWVMHTGMMQMVQWYKEGLNPGRLALNLSIKQLEKDDFFQTLARCIEETGCKQEWIEMEITEGHIMRDPVKAIGVLQKISDMGISLAIDDFGTGYSSLAYLKHLPVDKLKIDQSFTQKIPFDEDDSAIVCSVIDLAKNMKMSVLAEGVEENRQKEFLLSKGCSLGQGYLYSKPVPAEQMSRFIKELNEKQLVS